MRNARKFTACTIAALLVLSLGSNLVSAEKSEKEPAREVYESEAEIDLEEDVLPEEAVDASSEDAPSEDTAEGETDEAEEETAEATEAETEAETAITTEAETEAETAEATEAETEGETAEETEAETEGERAEAVEAAEADTEEEAAEAAEADTEEEAAEATEEATEEETAEETEEVESEEETEEVESEAEMEFGIMTLSLVKEVEIDESVFPDSGFRDFVEENFDSNGDGILDEEEISAVTELELSDASIHSLEGIEIFTSLETLTITDMELDDPSIYLTGNTSLKNVLLKDVTIGSGYLNFSGCTSLETLYLLFVDSANLNISECSSLKEVDLIYMEGLETVNISGDSSLQYLYYNDPITLYADENSSIPEVGEFVLDDDDNEVWIPNPDVTIIFNSGTPETEPDGQGGGTAGGSGTSMNGNTTKSGSTSAASNTAAKEESHTAVAAATGDSTPIAFCVSLMILAIIVLSAGVVRKLGVGR